MPSIVSVISLTLLTVLAGALLSGPVSAQPRPVDPATVVDLGVKEGQLVRVVTQDGVERAGTVTSLSASTLDLTNRDGMFALPVTDIRRISVRYRDPIKNGVGIGALVGATTGLAFGLVAIACDDVRA